MIQGTYLKWPETGDRSSVFSPAISEDLEILDSHNHNGVNSAKLDAKSLTKGSVTLLDSGWTDTGSDYRQLVTLPSGYDFDTCNIRAFINSGTYAGYEFVPTIYKASSSTFYLHCIYGNVSVKVVIS
jgi:hypothetical protein